jgi:hypothetical protein
LVFPAISDPRNDPAEPIDFTHSDDLALDVAGNHADLGRHFCFPAIRDSDDPTELAFVPTFSMETYVGLITLMIQLAGPGL